MILACPWRFRSQIYQLPTHPTSRTEVTTQMYPVHRPISTTTENEVGVL